MKFFTIILFICISLFAQQDKYIDFGVNGRTYPILENDFEEEIKKKVQEFKIDQEEVRKQVIAEVKKAALKTTNLPLCLKDKNMKPEIDYVAVPENVFNPLGRLIYSKGQKLESKIPAGKTLDLCFVDGRNKIATKNQINELSKIYPKCIFLIANENVLYLREEFKDKEIFPTSKPQEDRFGIECYPATVHMELNTKENKYYSYDRFKN